MDPWSSSTSDSPLSILPTATTLSSEICEPLVKAKNALLVGRSETTADDPDTPDLHDNKVKITFFSAVCTGDLVQMESLLVKDPELVSAEYEGFPALVYAVVLGHLPIADSLLDSHGINPNTPDSCGPNYTPLMWAVAMQNSEAVKLLLDYDADPDFSPKGDGACASAMVSIDTPLIHQYFKRHQFAAQNDLDVYSPPPFNQTDGYANDLLYKFQMLTLSDDIEPSTQDLDEEAILAQDSDLVQLAEFDYEKILPDQFIKFTDSDIPSMVDYMFSLREKSSFQHNTKAPVAILYQLIRYSHNKVSSRDLTDFLFECFIARVRSVTNTKSGVFNMALTTDANDIHKASSGSGDIVLLSYWLSAINFLHFYFAKGKIYQSYPKYLQELINLVQSLIATLSFSINSRLNLLVDECILNFTSLFDVTSVLYAKDWNLFKSQKKHPNSYDDIMDMLFPPTEQDLMKPSPLRYVQTLGALDYVLSIHDVDPLLCSQAFSQVFYYVNTIIFNRIISNSKYCTRVKAMQIRLNLSALEDWLRSHDKRIPKPESIGGLDQLLGTPESGETPKLTSLLDPTDSSGIPTSLSFYYKSLYQIGRAQLMPTIELLQWLQVMSGLQDEESLINTINELDCLNYFQLFKVAHKLYRYEVEEKKLPKRQVQILKQLSIEQGESQVAKGGMHYMTQSTFLLKELYILLNPNFVFGVALPNLKELINSYGVGIGGVRKLRAKRYQPTIPMAILDDVDEILTKNRIDNANDTFDYEAENVVEEELAEDENGSLEPTVRTFKGDELFKEMQPPLSLVHKNWGDMEVNPW